MSIWKKILFILYLIQLLGCGYQMVGKETHVPPGLNSVAIPTFKNQTFEPGIEVPFTQAFLREFIQDRRVNVVDRAEADSVLEGIIRDFSLYSVSFDKSGFVIEYQSSVILDCYQRSSQTSSRSRNRKTCSGAASKSFLL
jgi:outer membrane lipopolysaccharide assembly protein LptE/RlpB